MLFQGEAIVHWEMIAIYTSEPLDDLSGWKVDCFGVHDQQWTSKAFAICCKK
jgi:hypothetical protein